MPGDPQLAPMSDPFICPAPSKLRQSLQFRTPTKDRKATLRDAIKSNLCDGLCVEPSIPSKGHGVKATRNFAKGDFIIELNTKARSSPTRRPLVVRKDIKLIQKLGVTCTILLTMGRDCALMPQRRMGTLAAWSIMCGRVPVDQYLFPLMAHRI